jgi:hypothetical protein
VAVSNKKSLRDYGQCEANLASNYKSDGPSKTYYFIETLNILTQKTIEVEIDKSPGFKSKPLVKVNSDLKTFPQVSSESSQRIYRYTLQLLHHQHKEGDKTYLYPN